MQLAPSLHRLGSSSLVNSYLIEDAGAITVIDAGLRGHWKDLLRELEAMGRSPVDIRALLLTHGDVDHLGFAERLRQEHGVPVFVGEADAAEARGEVPKPAAARDRMRLVPMTKFLVYGLTHGGLRSTPIKEVTPIDGATTLDVPGAPAVIPLPGHTPGSVAYHVPSVDAIFMGDAMTTRSVTTGIVGPALAPFTVDPAMALASLAALDGLSANWVLPGHGDAWTGGVPEALRLIRTARAKPAA
jgi:glyoxylase-like metal-dependent hydrolase (beta-lactamase superfamily II)